MDWHFLVFIGAFCAVILALLICLFSAISSTSYSEFDQEENVATTRLLPEETRTETTLDSMPLPESHVNENDLLFNTPYPRNLPPLGFESISTLLQSELIETLDSMGTRPPYPLDEEISTMPQPMTRLTRTQVPIQACSIITTPHPRDTSTSYVPETIPIADFETGENCHPEGSPPSYDEAVGHHSSTRSRFRRFNVD